MFICGHIGVGYRLAKPWPHQVAPLLIGTLLPDLIDKTLYYGAAFYTGKTSIDIGLISGTRTFGHTLLFLVILGLGGFFSKRVFLKSLFLGVLSHFLLDYFTDFFRAGSEYNPEMDPLYALMFPFLGWRFPYSLFRDAREHVGGMLVNPFILMSETLGIWIIYREGWIQRLLKVR